MRVHLRSRTPRRALIEMLKSIPDLRFTAAWRAATATIMASMLLMTEQNPVMADSSTSGSTLEYATVVLDGVTLEIPLISALNIRTPGRAGTNRISFSRLEQGKARLAELSVEKAPDVETIVYGGFKPSDCYDESWLALTCAKAPRLLSLSLSIAGTNFGVKAPSSRIVLRTQEGVTHLAGGGVYAEFSSPLSSVECLRVFDSFMCTAARRHESGIGYLAKFRLGSGELTLRSLEAIARAAEQIADEAVV